MTDKPLDYAKVKAYADKIMGMIREDVINGVHPWTVRTFSALHDKCDANEYLEHAGQVYDGSDYSIREICAVQEEVEQRLMAGEISGRRSFTVTWNVTEQHQATYPENQLRLLFELDPDDDLDIDTLADPDEAFAEMEEGHDTWHSDYGRSVENVEQAPDRELDADEASAVGLDCTGRDGHHAFPYRWSSLTDEMREVLRLLGGSVTKAAGAFTDQQVYDAQLKAGLRRPEDLARPTMTYAEIKRVSEPTMPTVEEVGELAQQMSGGPDDVAAMVAHDAAAGLPGFTRVDPERGTMAWAERVMLGGTPQQRQVKQAASHRVVSALAETTEDLGATATADTIVQGVAHRLSPAPALLDLVNAVTELRELDAAYWRLVDEGNDSGEPNKQDDVKEQASDQAREALRMALALLGVTE